ncbi:DUF2752 domain-containing protein [Zhouia sp. PK063]|uniref:DUF2752 domain-containing protein n=1 Tax=Zhouia sp. PK063 TaxID=3373602 RepID=UPI0037AA9E03
MLPCLNKKLFGIDCPGCGMQRATVLFFKGNFQAAFHMYPAIFTLIPLFIFLGINIFVKFKYDYQIRLAFIILNVIIIAISYIYKMTHLT